LDRFPVIIPAAGQGKRMKNRVNKQFILLQGMPVIVHTLRIFQAAGVISDIVLVCAPGEEDYYRKEIISNYRITKPTVVVTGGKERQDSVYSGLSNISDDCRYVMVHDGARPLATAELVARVAEEVRITGAAVAGVPVKDTIKRTDPEGYITETLPRERLWNIQTPQAFELKMLKRAHLEARARGFYGTDDAALIERLGQPVKIVPGLYENIKLTTPEDLIIAEAILERRESR